MDFYRLQMPPVVYGGARSLEKLEEIVRAHGKRVSLFCDQGIVKAGLLETVLDALRPTAAQVRVIDDVPTEPLADEITHTLERYLKSPADLLIALGGGSVMDTVKLMGVLASRKYDISDLLSDPGIAHKSVPTVMIPTTAGTGSEATPNAIVNVPERQLKVGIVSTEMIADYVILDPRMIASLPRAIAASTGIDALAHAIECYTSNIANPFSDMVSLEALRLIFDNIETSCDTADPAARNTMLLASFYAGVAITSAGTTAVHALSYPLGGKYRIPHGVSNAILLVPVMRFNEPYCRNRLARVCDAVRQDGSDRTEEEKSVWVIDRMGQIVRNLDIPTSLKEFGVPSGDLEGLVEAGMQVTRLLKNNRRTVTAADAREIYRALL